MKQLDSLSIINVKFSVTSLSFVLVVCHWYHVVPAAMVWRGI